MAYLLKLKKDDMIEIAKELGIEAQNTFTKVEIMNKIIQSESYEEEIVKAVVEGVLEEKMEERRQIRKFELKRMRLANITDRTSVSTRGLEGQGVNRRVNLRDLVPKFDPKNADINSFFEIFEKIAKKRKGSRGKKGFIADSVTSDRNRGVSELVDHFIDSWDEFKEASILAEKLDHFKTVKKVSRKQSSTKTSDRKPFDKQPIENNNKSLCCKGKTVGSPKKDSCKDEIIQESSQFRRERMRERERQFERKRLIICYYCNEIGHIKPSCPRLRENSFETVENLNGNSENEDPFEKFKVKMKINGVDRVCLRDSGSSIDVCTWSWIRENDFLWEYVWLKSPLDDVCNCLPLAKIKLKTKNKKRDEFYTKGAIKPDGRSDDPHLLGNRTAELIHSSEQCIQLVNAIVTRSARKIHPTEAGKEIIAREQVNTPLKLVSPSEEKEKEFEIPPFEGGKEIILAKINGSEFAVEQKKCKDLKVLWYKARSGVDKEFGIYNGKLIRLTKTKRGEEIR
ncbi:uncharacterized protein NPIL_676391 [Nephila pilipes]|uniref:CCHC-type domain-containing protein n=1 Tax=Nephila pilipes TaxID=299642 RepID=A0A8X6MRY8_NEPPI|nr:uncharacterized protein NPIL_676391 [Nephila pilipes]